MERKNESYFNKELTFRTFKGTRIRVLFYLYFLYAVPVEFNNFALKLNYLT